MVPETDLERFAEAHAAGAFVVDVRETGEYRTGHVPGARPMPLDTLPLHLAEIPRDRPVHVICRSGGRSARATELLRSVGVDAVSVTGGTEGWADSGRPVAVGDTPGPSVSHPTEENR